MSKYKLEVFDKSVIEQWDRFVEASNNGTVFHRQDFLSYHPPGRFEKEDLVVYKEGEIAALFPLASGKDGEGNKIGLSPYGSSFGGLVTATYKAHELIEIASLIKKYLLEQGYHALRISCAPLVYHKKYSAGAEYFFLQSPSSVPLLETRRICSVIPLTGEKKYSSNIKRNIKKAGKENIQVRLCRDLHAFYHILQETIKTKHNAAITHSLEDLDYLVRTLPGHIDFALAYREEKAVAGVMCLFNSSPCVTAFYNCFLMEFKKTGALTRTFDFLIDYYYGKGKQYLDLGATSRFGNPVNMGLLQFKEGLGALQYNRDYFYTFLESD